jgi:pimeloyl-ACP methyl ester carboxylesterase
MSRVNAPSPPGRLVDVGGLHLHAIVQGSGAPAIVMESGMWDLALTWSLVQPEVASSTTAVAYDRAGLGWSEVGASRRTAGAMVSELRALLAALSLEPPHVLVAQSTGGLTARLFAYRYPDEVAGMVLIDAAHEDQFERFPAQVREVQPSMFAMQVEHLRGLRDRLAAGTPVDAAMVGLPQDLPDEVVRGYASIATSDASRLDTMIGELECLEESDAEVRAARGDGSLGDIPLVVISHGTSAPLPPIVKGGDETAQAYEASWQAMQIELASSSSRGRHIIAVDRGHMIHHEDPRLVIAAIRDVVGAAREEVAR